MTINKNTWHYKLWEFSNELTTGYIPESTNLCSYFHRVFWSSIFLFPFYYLWRGFVFLLGFNSQHMELVHTSWANEGEEYKTASTEYKYKSKIRTVITSIAFLIFYICLPLIFPWISKDVIWVKIPISLCIGALILGALILWIEYGRKVKDSFMNISFDYLTARKAKVCPTINFTKGENNG
jgi:hypothetical protein